MAKAASKKAATKTPAKRTRKTPPKDPPATITGLDKVQDGVQDGVQDHESQVPGPGPMPPHDTTHDVPAPVQPKESKLKQYWEAFLGLSLLGKVIIGAGLFLAVMGIINTCNSSDRIVRKHREEIAPAVAKIAALQRVNDSLAGVAVAAKRDALHAEQRADIIEAKLEVIMQDRNLSQTQQTQIRTAIKKQTDATTQSIYSSNSIADLDRKLDSLRRARKQDVIND